MANKVLDVRHVVDEMVSPDGLKTGGGGGTSDYEDLDNLPKINGVVLKGNKSTSDLNIETGSTVSVTQVQSTGNKIAEVTVDGNTTELFAPESAVTGVKGDSETDYRTGNVNITKANIGLGDVRNQDVGDQSDLETTATNLVGAVNELRTTLLDKQFVFDQSDFTKLGLTSTSSFTEICEKVLSTAYQNTEILLWVNQDTTAGNTIKTEIENGFSESGIYGYAVFKGMRHDFVQVTVYTYTTNTGEQKIYQRNYNKINGTNYGKWAKLTMTYATTS